MMQLRPVSFKIEPRLHMYTGVRLREMMLDLPPAVIAVKDREQLLKVPLREEPDRVRQVGAVRDEGGRGGGGGLGRHSDLSSINHLIDHLYHSWRILTVNYVAKKVHCLMFA